MNMNSNRIHEPKMNGGGFLRAFTLIETVVVVAIIALLAAITIGVGASMADSGRKRATEGVLQVLDQMLDEYISTTGSIPSPLVAVTLQEQVAGQVAGDVLYYPAVDGVFNVERPQDNPDAPVRHYQINSVGLFLVSIEHASDISGLTGQISDRLIKHYDVVDDLQPGMLTVFDAWGNPIRYVHPKFDGIIETGRRVLGNSGRFLDVMDPNNGFFTVDVLPVDSTLIPITEIRRNKILTIDRNTTLGIEADSDGGKCPSQRPYFYSAGPDGDPSTVEDNVYTTQPEFINPF